jgi:predicted nucleic acid-binding protein
MRVVIDNNVIVDALEPRVQFEAEAAKIIQLAGSGEIEGCICASSLSDVFYVVRKARGAEYTKSKLKELMLFTEVIPLTEFDCLDAVNMQMNDFEDALIAVCAERAGADCVVSRDQKFIKADSGVKVVTPDQLLSQFDR